MTMTINEALQQMEGNRVAVDATIQGVAKTKETQYGTMNRVVIKDREGTEEWVTWFDMPEGVKKGVSGTYIAEVGSYQGKPQLTLKGGDPPQAQARVEGDFAGVARVGGVERAGPGPDKADNKPTDVEMLGAMKRWADEVATFPAVQEDPQAVAACVNTLTIGYGQGRFVLATPETVE